MVRFGGHITSRRREEDPHSPESPNRALTNKLSSLNERIIEQIAVRHTDFDITITSSGNYRIALSHGLGHWLLDKCIATRLDRLNSDFRVRLRWGTDVHQIRLFPGKHLANIIICCRNAVSRGQFPGSLSIYVADRGKMYLVTTFMKCRNML